MFLLLWRGWGLLAVAYPLVSVLVANVVVVAVAGNAAWSSSSVGPGLGLVAGGALCWITGRRINGPAVPYLARTTESGQAFRPRVPFFFAQHNFCFVPLEAWGVLFVAIGAVIAVRGLTGT